MRAPPGPIGPVTTYTYDDRDRCIEVAEPGGLVTRFRYDDACHRILVTAPGGGVTDRLDSPGHRLVQVRDPRTGATTYVSEPIRIAGDTYTFDAEGKLIAGPRSSGRGDPGPA